MRSELSSVLTPEQRERLDDWMAHEGRGEHGPPGGPPDGRGGPPPPFGDGPPPFGEPPPPPPWGHRPHRSADSAEPLPVDTVKPR
jgi:hypothetical protein